MEHEVHAGEHRLLQGVRGLVGGLGVGGLRRAQAAAAAEGHSEAAGERGGDEEHETRLRRAEGRRSGLHGDGAAEGAEDHRRAGTHELGKGHAGQRLGEELGAGAGHGDRRHRSRENEWGDTTVAWLCRA